MAELVIEMARHGAEVVLRLRGDLDLSAEARLADELARLEATSPTLLTIDLSGLAFMDSTGARLIVAADERARANGRRLAVIPGAGGPRRVIEVLGLDGRLTILDGESGASAASG